MSVRVETDGLLRLKDATSPKRVMYQLSTQVLDDCNRYARKMTGHLIDTSAMSDKFSGVLSWTTPYALEVYYTGRPSTAFNPHARLMWCEYARQAHGAEWTRLLLRMIAEEAEKC